jgi:hypothetical protein
MNKDLKPGQGIGQCRVSPVVPQSEGGAFRIPGTRTSPGLVVPVVVRSMSRDKADWRITTNGAGPFVRVPDVPSDSATYLEFLESSDYTKDFGAVSYGRPRSGRTKGR